MQTILLTVGRGPFPLTLARCFHAAGHKVIVADVWPRTLCHYSQAVAQCFQVPSPATANQAWLKAIQRIVRDCAVDLIVPIYEETLYLAQALAQWPDPPKIFAPDLASLLRLHDKWRFNQQAAALGLTVPATELLASRDALIHSFTAHDGSNKVFKPVCSRFATQTLIRPKSLAAFDKIIPTAQKPWIAQDFLPGRPYSTFSVAHRGQITAHATYAPDFCLRLGPTSVYQHVAQPAVFKWVQSFIAATRYTGQIGIDFMETAGGEISAIECNPRLTGGLYLLKDDPALAAAYLDPNQPIIQASTRRSYAFRAGLFLTLFRHTRDFPGYKTWCHQYFSARSVNEFLLSDPKPRLMAPFLDCAFLARCLRERQNPQHLLTNDMDWNEQSP